MQVRSIEFQENFGRVPVEASRQQNLLMREPAAAQQHAAQVLADEHVNDLNRPGPTTETEGTIVDPDAGREEPGGRRRPERRPPEQEGPNPEAEVPSRDPRIAGRKLDVVA